MYAIIELTNKEREIIKMKLRNYLGVSWKDISKEEQETLLKEYWYETTTDATSTPAGDNSCILEFMDENDWGLLVSIGGTQHIENDELITEPDANCKFYTDMELPEELLLVATVKDCEMLLEYMGYYNSDSRGIYENWIDTGDITEHDLMINGKNTTCLWLHTESKHVIMDLETKEVYTSGDAEFEEAMLEFRV